MPSQTSTLQSLETSSELDSLSPGDVVICGRSLAWQANSRVDGTIIWHASIGRKSVMVTSEHLISLYPGEDILVIFDSTFL